DVCSSDLGHEPIWGGRGRIPNPAWRGPESSFRAGPLHVALVPAGRLAVGIDTRWRPAGRDLGFAAQRPVHRAFVGDVEQSRPARLVERLVEGDDPVEAVAGRRA